MPEYKPADSGQPGQPFNSSGFFYQAIGKLLIVVGLLLVMGYLARKLLPGRFGGAALGDNLKLVQSLPLGQRRFVSLIEADGKRFLIGVTDNQVNLLKALDDDPFAATLAGMAEPKRVSEMMEEA